MMKKTLAVVGLGAAIGVGSLFSTGTANATPDYAVCTGISQHLAGGQGYQGYLIDAYVWGKAFNYDQRTQARNIVDSVLAYCPEYGPGLQAAANSLSS